MPMDFDAGFREKVDRHAERLTSERWPVIERRVAEKRLAWCAEHPDLFAAGEGASPRRAFDLLFFDYMGQDSGDLTVVAESADEIVWHSANPCPTLEACKATGLDTRSVCRAVYEKSTQALISALDPRVLVGWFRRWLVGLLARAGSSSGDSTRSGLRAARAVADDDGASTATIRDQARQSP